MNKTLTRTTFIAWAFLVVCLKNWLHRNLQGWMGRGGAGGEGSRASPSLTYCCPLPIFPIASFCSVKEYTIVALSYYHMILFYFFCIPPPPQPELPTSGFQSLTTIAQCLPKSWHTYIHSKSQLLISLYRNNSNFDHLIQGNSLFLGITKCDKFLSSNKKRVLGS